MCGIVGVAGYLGNREQTVFSNLLAWDIVRGPHATGLAAVRYKTNDIHILKRSMHAYDFMDLKAYEPSIKDAKVLIGHNRFGTVGANSHRNAHPFVFDNVVGVHNGTIPYSDRKVLKDHDKYDTDSEALFANISEFGPKEAIKDLKGAWSLCWWDRVEHKLNFLRNKERPMYWTLSDTKKEMYWASESPMLQAVLARHSIKHGPVYGTSEDTMLSFTIPDDYSDIGPPERTEVKGAAPFVFQSSQRGLGAWNDEEDWYGHGSTYTSRHRTETALPTVGIEAKKSLSDLRLTGPGNSSQLPHSVGKHLERRQEEASSESTSRGPEAGGMLELVEAVRQRLDEDEQLGSDQSDIPFTPGPASGTNDNLVHLKDKMKERGPTTRLVQVFNGSYANKEEFDKVSKNGCAYCEKHVQFGEVLSNTQTVHWLKRDAFLCDECMDDPEILEYLAGMNVELPQRKKLN